MSLDEFGGENVSTRPQIIVDVGATVRVTDRLQLFFRPWFRLPRPNFPTAPVPPWEKEIWQGGVRYERPGDVALRVDAGYMSSPIGLGLLDERADVNPTIVPHLSYRVPMPAFEATAPRQLPVGNTYPLGAQITVSTARWDARAALLNSSPTRHYALGNDDNPRPTPSLVAGGGLTPFIGLRFGASVARGQYATAEERTVAASDGLAVTMIGGEAEYAFRYTKLSAEIMRAAFETTAQTAVAYEWFAQARQTLTPRWFLAAREEGTSAPPLRTGTVVGRRSSLHVFEGTAGYRVSPAITLRGSYVARRLYGATAWDHQAGVMIVWVNRFSR